MHNLGYPVRVWGFKDSDQKVMKDLINYGVDGMTTNYPDILRKVYKRIRK